MISTVLVGTTDDAGTTVPGGGHIGPGGDAGSFAGVAATAGVCWADAGAAAGGVEQGISPAKPQVDAAGASGAVVAQLAAKARAQAQPPSQRPSAPIIG